MRIVVSLTIVLLIAVAWGIKQYHKLRKIRLDEERKEHYKASPLKDITDKQEA